MADKRMFSMKIVDSDAFLDMPLSTQALYFQLGMRADDDGFVSSPRKIQKLLGASDDDMKILLAKRYILAFDSGIIVIKHWKINNYIQKDRYKPSVYIEEKSSLTLKDNGSYTEVDTLCIQSVSTLDTQSRLDKNRIDKNRIGECTPAPARERYGEFQNVVLSRQEYEKLTESIGGGFRDDYINRLDLHIEQKGVTYRSHYATILKWYLEDHPKKSGGSFDTDDFYAMAIAASYKDGGG